jgi:hypothetical protein
VKISRLHDDFIGASSICAFFMPRYLWTSEYRCRDSNNRRCHVSCLRRHQLTVGLTTSPKQGCVEADYGRIGIIMARCRGSWLSIRRGDPVAQLGIASVIMISTMLSMFTNGASAGTSSVKWSPPVQIGSKSSSATQVNYSVSCPSSTFCVSVNGDGKVSYYRNGEWSKPQSLALGGSIDSVSCSSKTFCVAVAAGMAASFNGHVWSSATHFGPSGDGYKVSCTSPTFCAAVGANFLAGKPGALLSYNGHSWRTYQTTSTGTVNDRLLSVSCSTPQFCIATNFDGQILSFNGSSWTPRHVAAPKFLISVSCTASKFCMAVTTTGVATTFQSGEWSRPGLIPKFTSAGAYSVSCVSPSECSVIGLSGAVTRWQSGKWSRPLTLFPGGYVSGVDISCSTGSNCVAVNDRGLSSRR